MSNPAQLLVDHLDIWTGAIERKSGSGRGNGGKISLYGIDKLRSLILDLAVRGKLVPQDSADEPAPLMNFAIGGAKDIPKGWLCVEFADALDFAGGGQPPKSHFRDYPQSGYVQLIQIRDLGPNPQPIYVDETLVTKFCTSRDIMIGRYGASVGKVFWGKDGAYNVALVKIIDLHSAFCPEFLFYFLKSSKGQSFFVGASRSAQAGFNKKDLADKMLQVPPLAEQKRIVAKVDELMALVDALEAGTRAGMEAHETLVRELLATLVNSQDSDDLAQNWSRIEAHFDTLFTTEESIDALKQTFVDLAVAGKISAGQASSWPHRPLGEFVAEVSAGWSPKCIETPRSDDKWGVLKVSAVTWGEFRPDENKELPGNLEPRPEIEIKPGDFLISRANTADLVARSVVVPQGAPGQPNDERQDNPISLWRGTRSGLCELGPRRVLCPSVLCKSRRRYEQFDEERLASSDQETCKSPFLRWRSNVGSCLLPEHSWTSVSKAKVQSTIE